VSWIYIAIEHDAGHFDPSDTELWDYKGRRRFYVVVDYYNAFLGIAALINERNG
jgi:hypothetical protein